jgi:hypothetical protein
MDQPDPASTHPRNSYAGGLVVIVGIAVAMLLAAGLVVAGPSGGGDVEGVAGATITTTTQPPTTITTEPPTTTITLPPATTTTQPPTSTTTQAAVEPEPIDAFAIAEGDCISLPDEDMVETVDSVPCASPHDAEAYALFDVAEGSAPYPGVDAVDIAATDGCIERFLPFVGTPYAYSDLDVFYLHPTEETWDELGDREIVCLITAMDGSKLIGSMEGSGTDSPNPGPPTDA